MTRLLVSLFLLGLSLNSFAQRTSHTMSFDGQQRTYATYVPNIYHQDTTAVPLLVNLHGISDNALNFTGLGYDDIADTANFIILAPQALDFDILGIYTIERIWNSGVGAEMADPRPAILQNRAGRAPAGAPPLSSETPNCTSQTRQRKNGGAS